MGQAGKITRVEPRYAIPGGEIAVECEGFDARHGSGWGVFIGEKQCLVVAASSSRILAIVPEGDGEGQTQIHLENNGARSDMYPIVVGKLLTDGMHIVANPAIDPSDDALVITRSGSRGQHLEATLFRLEPDGYLDEMPEAILNPTGIAFDGDGQMFVTNRAQGEVYSVGRDGTSSVYATGLGIATGLCFDKDGLMYVGDRSGTIYRVRDYAEVETFTVMDPSVAAYHMAFGPDGRLFVTAPGLASHDAVHVIDHEGFDEAFFRGLGRPQGLAFDKSGNLYIAACYQGRHGIVKISPDGQTAEHLVAGNSVVGLCFTRKGDMIVATNNSVYSIPCGIEGTLL
ncbi:MAG: gluconolaconase [Chloracidobacterium sp.]|nr:gluconolaconase [Chloracidobacterium sp.]